MHDIYQSIKLFDNFPLVDDLILADNNNWQGLTFQNCRWHNNNNNKKKVVDYRS